LEWMLGWMLYEAVVHLDWKLFKAKRSAFKSKAQDTIKARQLSKAIALESNQKGQSCPITTWSPYLFAVIVTKGNRVRVFQKRVTSTKWIFRNQAVQSCRMMLE